MDHLGFTCPRCGVDLVVPASAAGVEGPCPRCGGVIRAPRFTPKPEEIPVRLEVVEEPMARAKPLAGFQPVAQQTFVESTAMRSDRKSSLRRTLLTAVIVVGLVSIVAGFLVAQDGKADSRVPKQATVKAQAAPPKQDDPSGEREPSPARDLQVAPEGMDVHEFVARSAEVLGAFLVARNLEERQPLMECRTPPEELGKSVLAGPLESTGNFESLEVKFDKVIGTNEVLFKCGFRSVEGRPDSSLVLVRARGSQEPKVVADPFLDTYGGRFGAFAATPGGDVVKFRVVATIFEFCSDETIPAHDLKYTMKIAVAPGSPDLAKAYFGKSSPLREKLERLGVRYGQGVGATVSLRWNMEGTPHIEVIDVDSLDWSE
ncbi:hypothetical protein OVA24_21065 [Luteolibacter sp. SL250]|uniref:hypothetical protein n=1 Tax=Luteolibacter sp. SL250 TaxID=2995170 RepID=UPI002270E00E|nr:hypothetical protein [Luteolibacter sp. SL250]WAC19713.1 hypothetical protein OVA24_21065 [Luteolibacter sp. SL250]